MIWIAFAALTGAAILCVLWPLSRKGSGLTRRESDVAFYKAQLAEIDADVARGLASAADAEGARIQAGRRLIAATQGPGSAYSRSVWGRRIAALACILAIPALSVGLYLHVGDPGLPDQPLSARLDAPANKMDVGVAVARIEDHLRQYPDDGRGWELLGPVYMQLGRFQEAANAFGNAIRTLGDSAEREQALGEALLAADDGQVGDKARAAFQRALTFNPKAPGPQFYLGLAAEQVGNKAGAAAIWMKLLAQAPADAPWTGVVRMHLAALGGKTGPAPPTGSAPGPTPAEAAQVAALTPDKQAAFIKTMVAGLAARLAKNGGGADEWSRLVRAYVVLHEPGKANSALADARRNLHSDPAALARLSTLARQLGLDDK